MESSARNSTGNGNIIIPRARIEAQDALFATPLREYLESYGCEVWLNKPGGGPFTYEICVGDTQFVKSFFERGYDRYAKQLAVIYEGDEADLADIASGELKYFFIDPKPVSHETTREIFAFFFTSEKKSKDARKEPRAHKKVSVMPAPRSREPDPSSALQQTADVSRIAQTIQQIFHPAGSGTSVKKHKRYTRAGIWLVAGAMCFVMPFILYASSLAVGAGLLALGGNQLMQGNTKYIPTLASYSRSYINASRTILSAASPLLSVVGLERGVRDQDRLLTVLSDVQHIERGVAQIFVTTRDVAGGILFPEGSGQTAGIADVVKLTTEVSRVSQHLALVSAQMDSLTSFGGFPFRTQGVSELLERGQGGVTKVRDIVGYTEKLLTIYPRIGGFRRKQTYLVLLQNSMELRPTGGFIGSLLLVTFLDGKVDTLEVQDVYTADGQLKGHIDPPLPIREILGNEHWYLRDSNWDPDFSVSGAQAAWFYEKELGVKPDGVIAISLPLVTRLLKVTGPIELLDFNERISESNFFAKSLLYTETDFFPGSTQKKDFLGSLMTALLTRITTDKSLSSGKLLQSLTESIKSKDIQFYFPDKDLENLLKQWSWVGGVDVASCQAPISGLPCVGDGIAMVAANLGVNKVNFFITQEALTQIHITEDGAVENTTTFNIHNGSEGETGGGGTYQAYMRVLVPADAELTSVTLDGVPVPARDMEVAAPPPAPYSISEDGPAFRTFHVPIAVPPTETRQLTVGWVRPKAVEFDQSFVYQLTIRKQAGVEHIPWNTVITYPESWGAIQEGGVAKAGVIEYNTDLTKDAIYRIVFQKQL